ncbi:MAG: hypothetical protein ABUL67_01540 [Haliangium ochraceum]
MGQALVLGGSLFAFTGAFAGAGDSLGPGSSPPTGTGAGSGGAGISPGPGGTPPRGSGTGGTTGAPFGETGGAPGLPPPPGIR